MALNTTPPTDQRAGVRPIAFVLDNGGALGQPVTLPIRPEDLTRSEPTRATVHQTLGRGAQGWSDDFGEGLPTVTIAGHTGWRPTGVSVQDGYEAFMRLNQLVAHEYSQAKQNAIDTGRDPTLVKLLYVDMLNNFTWSVSPVAFQLRRNKSSPLLLRYNITMQAVSTTIDNPLMVVPFFGSIAGGLGALGGAISAIEGFAGQVLGWVNKAVSYVNGGLGYVAGVVSQFTYAAHRVLKSVNSIVSGVQGGFTSIANNAIGIARDLSNVGVAVFRTLSNIANLPSTLKAQLGRVASAFNEVVCIFSNALRPRKTYESYESLYGASNCSSTTGGRPASAYAGTNVFGLLSASSPMPISLNTGAQTAVAAINKSDPALAPMPLPEMSRNLGLITTGIRVEA